MKTNSKINKKNNSKSNGGLKGFIFLSLILLSFIGTAFAGDEFGYSKLTETLLNQDPDPVEAGEYVELRFKVEKEGNEELTDIQYELVPEYPFSFDQSDIAIKDLNDWTANSDAKEYYILYYKMLVDKNAVADTYELSLFQTSTNPEVRREIKFDVRVEEKKTPNLIIGLIDTNPKKVVADYDEAKFEMEIVNNGDEMAENVIVSLDLPQGFEESFGYSTLANLGTIDAGDSKNAIFYLDTLEGLKQGSYPTQISINYTEDNDDSKQNYLSVLPVDLKVFGKPEYEIVDVILDEGLSGGDNAEVRIVVKNVGSKKAESTSAQVFKDSSQPFDFDDKTDYIGELDIGESGDAVFTFLIEENAVTKDYKLDIQIRSIVDGEVLVDEKSITIPVQEKQKESFLNLQYVLGGLVLFVGAGAYSVGKKQR